MEHLLMHKLMSIGLALACWALQAQAQVAPTAAPDQLALLASDDPRLARNKHFVFDFWRIVFEGGHLDQRPKYMAETYIQHNPNVSSGRAAFVALFSKERRPAAGSGVFSVGRSGH